MAGLGMGRRAEFRQQVEYAGRSHYFALIRGLSMPVRARAVPVRRFLAAAMAGWWSCGLQASELPLPEVIDPQHCGPVTGRSLDTEASGELEVEAERITRGDGRLELQGDVRFRYGAWRAGAETATVDTTAQQAALSGGVRISGPGVVLAAVQAEVDYGRKRGEATDVQYRLDGGATGRAARVRGDASGVVEAEQATYSTCALEAPLWHLQAEELRLDAEAGAGEARRATLHLGGTPVMALPWVGFPVGEARKSGWLVPEVGTSDSLGYSLETPYYLNLAPHYDAVLSARYMGRRGLQLRPSARYRTRHGAGAAQVEYLSDQEVEGDDDRYLLHWRHRGVRPDGWDYRVHYTNVSDGRYLEDFESGISGLSATRLRQEAHVAWRTRDWRVQAALVGTDPLKERSESWDRLPRIRADGVLRWPAAGVQVEPRLAVDAFRGDRDQQQVTGERYDAAAVVSRPFDGTGWRVTPRLEWRHTRYDLKHAPASARRDGSPRRTVPTISLDARMRFVRRTADGDVQLLEPRLFYLNRPHREQDDLPQFDTRRMEPDFEALFRHREHAGLDRTDAADRLAAGLGTRLVDAATGHTKLQAKLARVWHFRAPGDDAEGTATHSAWAAQVEWRPEPTWRIASSVRYDTGPGASDVLWASHTLGWRGSDKQQVLLRYVRRAGEVEQASAQTLWPLGGGWQLAARYHYDLRADRGIESLVALEHRSCCVTVGLGLARVRHDELRPDGDSESRLMLQVRFHGLAGFGEDVVARMRRELAGRPAWSR